ncbi:MAG: hypothetical protein GX221_05725 [Candidatus Riflebacteria bacterium]|nr:hypothetical protein [Candidatus Riflebacteria bacterium]
MIFGDSMIIMLLGMFVVYVFLALMCWMIYGLFPLLNKWFPEEATVTKTTKTTTSGSATGNEAEVAAAVAIVKALTEKN